ncbi:MAG TPA: prepilin peptidase [Candidatus Saccharimonadales bacterium]|nr:prepilin peptidase [Candidatus Saccharimonadales bacterium]
MVDGLCATIAVMIIVLIGILGLIFGSFVNALVWRLYEQEKLADKKGRQAAKQRQALSIAHGRSMCSHCHHMLAAKDLVPVLSWLSLGGRCRYCRKPIADSPLVEVATGALFALSYAFWPLSYHGMGLFELIVWLALVVLFVALAVYDLRWFLLPDRLVLPVTILAGLQTLVVALWTRSWHELYMGLLAGAIIFGLFWLLYQVSKGAWIGGGDVKLAIALGLTVGTPLKAGMVIFLASLLGTLVSVPVLLKGKKALETRIPFGPYLLAATVIVVLWGGAITSWYQNVILG